MIKPLRRQHRLVFWVLAILLPLVFAAALSSRSTVPAGMPKALSIKHLFLPVVLGESRIDGDEDANPPSPTLRLLLRASEETPPQRVTLDVYPEQSLNLPDVLLYWAPSPDPAEGQALPAGSRLIGATPLDRDTEIELQELLRAKAFAGAGHWVFYSLAHDRLLASCPLKQKEAP